MGAIYGFAGFQEDDLLGRMARVSRPRGPVDDGFFFAPNGGLMAMGRTTPAGRGHSHGPAFSADRQITVVVAGSVLNWREVAEELAVPPSGEAAVLVAGYEAWGVEGLLPRLQGGFGLAVCDGRDGSLHVARDRMGRQPLYYAQPGGRLLFASGIKPLLQSAHVEARLNLRQLDLSLALGEVPGPASLFAGVLSLPPGHRLHRTREGVVHVTPWWSTAAVAAASPSSGDEVVYFEAFATMWNTAVREAFGEAAPEGVIFEGRMEEALLASAVARARPQARFLSFHSSQERRSKAVSAAEELAKALGLTHQPIGLDGSVWQRLPELVWQMERPFADPLWLARAELLNQASSEASVWWGGRSAGGLAGGEGLAGVLEAVQSRCQLMPRAARHGLLLPGFAFSPWQWPGLLKPLVERLGAAGARARLRDVMARYALRSLAKNDAVLRALWGRDERRALYTNEFKSLATEEAVSVETSEEQKADLRRRLFLLELHGRVPVGLEMESAIALPHAAAWQHPLLDHRLVELALRLPPALLQHRARPGKLLSRLAAQILPKPARKALQASAPPTLTTLLFHPEFESLVAEHLEPERVRQRGLFVPEQITALRQTMTRERDVASARCVLALVTLELWQRIFIDKDLRFTSSGE